MRADLACQLFLFSPKQQLRAIIVQYTLPYLPGLWDLMRLAMSAVAPSEPKSEEAARVRREAGPCSHGVVYRRGSRLSYDVRVEVCMDYDDDDLASGLTWYARGHYWRCLGLQHDLPAR